MADCFCSSWPEAEPSASRWPVPGAAVSPSSFSAQFPGLAPAWPAPAGKEEPSGDRAETSRSHNQAEKRRRDRINSNLAALRKLIPMSEKMDKAALLGGVIDRVKDLKTRAAEATVGDQMALIVPAEVDEVTVDRDRGFEDPDAAEGGGGRAAFIRASVSCEDRPEVFGELAGAVRGVGARLVRAEIASLGGRTRSVLVLCARSGEEGACIGALREALGAALGRVATLSAASSCRFTSKRQRFFFAPH